MLRLTCLLVLLPALFGFSENVLAQNMWDEIESIVEPIARPQLEAPSEDFQDPPNPRGIIDEDEIEPISRPQLEAPSEGLRDPLDPSSRDDEDDDADEDAESSSEDEELTPERLTDERIRSNWPRHSMSDINLSLAEVGRLPKDRSELLDGYGRVGPVSESVKVFAWEAPNIRYQPLYFEDVVLERYGQTLTDYRQGIRSAIRFGTAFTGWSLQMLETNPKSCDHPLGYCRPGTCVPQTTQRHFFGALSLR